MLLSLFVCLFTYLFELKPLSFTTIIFLRRGGSGELLFGHYGPLKPRKVSLGFSFWSLFQWDRLTPPTALQLRDTGTGVRELNIPLLKVDLTHLLVFQ